MNLSPGTLAAFIVPLAFAGFAAFWCLICFIIARTGGWHALATRFPAGPQTPLGVQWYQWQSMDMDGSEYRGTVNLGIGSEGLYLSVMALFALGHIRIFIPWSAVNAVQTNNRWRRACTVLIVPLENRSPIRITLYNTAMASVIAPHLTHAAVPMR